MLGNPIILGTSLYLAVMYGIIYLLFTTFSVVFQSQYGFKEGIGGLVYLGLGVGTAIGIAAFGKSSDAIYTRLTTRHGEAKPEYVSLTFCLVP
jgi:predicted MFS family arabinose efflux permease